LRLNSAEFRVDRPRPAATWHPIVRGKDSSSLQAMSNAIPARAREAHRSRADLPATRTLQVRNHDDGAGWARLCSMQAGRRDTLAFGKRERAKRLGVISSVEQARSWAEVDAAVPAKVASAGGGQVAPSSVAADRTAVTAPMARGRRQARCDGFGQIVIHGRSPGLRRRSRQGAAFAARSARHAAHRQRHSEALIESQQAQSCSMSGNTAGVSLLRPRRPSTATRDSWSCREPRQLSLNGSLPIVNLIDLPLEDKDRVEGAERRIGAVLCLPRPPAYQFTIKRPTREPYLAATVIWK